MTNEVTRSYLQAVEDGDIPSIKVVNACRRWLRKYAWRFWLSTRSQIDALFNLAPRVFLNRQNKIGDKDFFTWMYRTNPHWKGTRKEFYQAVKQTAGK